MKVTANVVLRNFVDVGTAKRGFINVAEIRTSELSMIVNTGAVMVFLPQDEVDKLGLETEGKVVVTYADERKEERSVAKGLELRIGNRSMVTDCIIGPPLCEQLIGQLVLEELDLVVDCSRKILGPRPESPNLPSLKVK